MAFRVGKTACGPGDFVGKFISQRVFTGLRHFIRMCGPAGI